MAGRIGGTRAAASAAVAVAIAAAAAGGAAPLCAASGAAATASEPGADAASRLAGMRLDGLAAGGHAVVLEFAARPGAGAGDAASGAASAQPARLALVGGLVRTDSGPLALGGGEGGASVMVTGGGTIVVLSTDGPAVVVAVPSGAGGGAALDRYTVTAYVPRGPGGFEAATFEATLGPSEGGGGDGASASGAASADADAVPAAADAGRGGRLPGSLALAVAATERVQFGGALVVQGRVYDADLNDSPAVVPRGPGAVPGAPVHVTVADRRTGEVLVDQDGAADEAGLFRAEYRWKNTDPAATLDVSVVAGGGLAAEELTAFYLGPEPRRPPQPQPRS